MKVLLIGSGGREHAIALMISRSTYNPKLYVVSDHNNPGLSRIARSTGGKLYRAKTTNPQEVLKVAKEVSPDVVVIGPEEPQFAGVPDLLRDKGFSVFGASSRCAEIERSKVFARTLMWKYSIPGRLYFRAFSSLEEARKFVEYAGDVVVKPARQVGGKGVKVLRENQAYLLEEYRDVKKDFVVKLFKEMTKYVDIDAKVLIEQRVEGVEYTAMTVTDGSYVLALPLVQDHPHVYEYDIGPETGGMGSISGPGWVLPFIEVDEFKRTIEIIDNVVKALQTEVKDRYVGALAGQMMLTALWGPTVIEFYSRFGDPEISNMVPVITSDFLEMIERTVDGRLAGYKLEIRDDVAVVVKAVAPAGYPLNKKVAANHPVSVDEGKIRELGCTLLYASVEELGDGTLRTHGSRAFEIVCYDESHEKASKKAELAISYIKSLDGWPLIHRSDIGSIELLKQRHHLAMRIRRTYKARARRGLLGTSIVWVPGKGIFFDPFASPVMTR